MDAKEFLEIIERAKREEWTEIVLRSQDIVSVPPEIGNFKT